MDFIHKGSKYVNVAQVVKGDRMDYKYNISTQMLVVNKKYGATTAILWTKPHKSHVFEAR